MATWIEKLIEEQGEPWDYMFDGVEEEDVEYPISDYDRREMWYERMFGCADAHATHNASSDSERVMVEEYCTAFQFMLAEMKDYRIQIHRLKGNDGVADMLSPQQPRRGVIG